MVGGAEAGKAAIAQVLLQEGAPASSPGKYLWLELLLVTTYLIWIPAPCPEWPHSCPRGAQSIEGGRASPPLGSSSQQFEECRAFLWRR